MNLKLECSSIRRLQITYPKFSCFDFNCKKVQITTFVIMKPQSYAKLLFLLLDSLSLTKGATL